MTDPDLWQKWSAARVRAAHQAPYLAAALLSLHPVMVTGTRGELRRFPTDTGWRVYVEVEELARQSVREVAFWLVHQVTHLLREHARRYPGGVVELLPEEQQAWNLATDAEINDDLTADISDLPPETAAPTRPGLPPNATTPARRDLPPDVTTPARLGLPDGWTAERYWHALREAAHRHEQPEHHNPPHPPTAPGDCGSGCDGLPRTWNRDDLPPALSPTTARLTALDTARRIRERLNAQDDVPAGWRRWAGQVLEPSVSWRRHLSARVRHGLTQAAGRADYTYRRPSRRAAALPGVVLPSLHRPLPSVTVLIDTSGSITETMLAQALAEVTGVLRAMGIARRLLTVITCDARAYRPQTLTRISDLRLDGGGGTDLRAGFAAALSTRPSPDLIIAITDGRTPWPHRPPRTRVIVALLDPAGRAPEWAQTVHVEGAS
ncbi:VWA-like domain-containing protein [Nonomuraea sp. NPDC050202]|uniref:vWA domain-containing protein n=1 Tax=Nonomuraea sp. NPDC050202 TaxID=3155035 RepID=UPI0033F18136